MRNNKNFLPALLLFVMSVLLVSWGSTVVAQKSRTALSAGPAAIQQPIFAEYKGVRLGMTAKEARTQLGEPALTALKDNDVDYFIISETETVQIGYDPAWKVKVISVDYQNGTGAPAPMTVVGAELEPKENGTLYRVMHYDSLGFWVSYSRITTPVIIVTITIQKK